jgi:cytoskeletal protein CcmA (bactofilin family)
MWRKRKDGTPRARRRLGAFLDEGSEMEGRYTCTGTVVIDAKFKGEITSRDTLIIGDQGVVHAAIETASLVVHGELVGNVTAAERVELKRRARVRGDIEAPVIVMEEGAVHDGHCRMTQAKAETALSVVVPIKA